MNKYYIFYYAIYFLLLGCSKDDSQTVVNLTNPEDGAVFLENSCTLEWEISNSDPNIVYDVYLGTNKKASGIKENKYVFDDIAAKQTYYWHVIARKENGKEIKSEYREFKQEIEKGSFTDNRDNETYNWIRLGDQTWMAENLAYDSEIGSCAYDNDESNVAKYGRLYNWEMAQEVCPDGWHLPSQEEWDTFLSYPVGDAWAEYYLLPESKVGAYATGFDIQPGGMYHWVGKFYGGRTDGWFWSSTLHDGKTPVYIKDCTSTNGMSSQNFSTGRGAHSVRCVKN